MSMTQAPPFAAGLDLGGTKIEAQIFDFSFNRVTFRRIPTPQTYDALVAAMVDQIAWFESHAKGLPLGIAAVAGTVGAEVMASGFEADFGVHPGLRDVDGE
eukprot:gene18406-25074_t